MTLRLRRAVSSSIVLPLLVALGTSTACRRDEPGPQRHLGTTRARANPPPELPSNELGRGTNAVAPGDGEEDSHRGLTSDAALPVPEPLREDVPLAADLLTARDVAGLILEAEWQWSDVPPPPSVPELSSEGLQDAATSTRLRVRVELAMSGRMRFVFEGHGYPWPDATELRSRADRASTITSVCRKSEDTNVGRSAPAPTGRPSSTTPSVSPVAWTMTQALWISICRRPS